MKNTYSVEEEKPNHWQLVKNGKNVVATLRSAGQERWIILNNNQRIATLTRKLSKKYMINQSSEYESIEEVAQALDNENKS